MTSPAHMKESAGTPVSAIRKFLIGKIAMPDHPATVLNPNGRAGFVIADVQVNSKPRSGTPWINDGIIYVRGEDTMWFGEGLILEVRNP